MNKNCLLIVDDEPLIVDLIKQMLEVKVDEILCAQNGKMALELIENNPQISCVICDIRMPIMDGIETIKKVREKNIETPFIFYTGHGDDLLIKEAAKYGAFDFLSKPKLEHLEEVVLRGLERGFEIKDGHDFDEEISLSEYRQFLDSIEEHKK